MEETVPEVELQHELQRFVSELSDRLSQATERLGGSPRPSVRDEALRQHLRQVAAAMEIATGPVAHVNLLDMLVFVRLCRVVLERHWIPNVFGTEATQLEEGFVWAERQLGTLAARVLSSEQQASLEGVLHAWLAQNPAQVRVEGIRLADFAGAAGAAAFDGARQSRGLLSSMRSASEAASQALLLSERTMFLVHRLPFLWRLQARVAARELLSDATATLLSGDPESPLPRFRARARRLAGQLLLSLGLLGGARLAVRRFAPSLRR